MKLPSEKQKKAKKAYVNYTIPFKNYLCIIGVSGRKGEKKKATSLFIKRMPENFPNLERDEDI